MDLDELLETVNSKETFLRFVEALTLDKADEEKKEKIKKSDPYGPGANGWENDGIIQFLEAIHAYGEDSSSIGEEANWKSFALLLYAGKFYE